MTAASLAWPRAAAAAGARGGVAPPTHPAGHARATGHQGAAPAAVAPASAAAAARRRHSPPVCSAGGGSSHSASPSPSAKREHEAAAAQLASQFGGRPCTDGHPRQRQQQRHGAVTVDWQQSELEAAIERQRSVDGVLALLENMGDDLPSAAAAAALYQLNRLSQAGGSSGVLVSHPVLPRLFRALQQGAGELHIRSLVGVLACCKDLGLRPPRLLADELADQLVRRLPAVAPAQACNALRNLTRLGSGDARDSLLSAVNKLVEQQLRELAAGAAAAPEGQQPLSPWLAQLTMAQLSSLLWVCAKAAFRSQPLLHGITQAMLAGGTAPFDGRQQQRQQQQQQSRSTVAAPQPGSPAWLAAAAGAHSNGAASRNAGEAKQLLAGLGPRQLSSLFYSLGTLRWTPNEQFLEPAAAAVLHQLPNLNSQGLANISWGVSQLPGSQPVLQQLAHALHAAAVPCLGRFSPQELGMMAVAGERTPRCSPELLKALGQQLQQRAGQLADRDVATLLTALAAARHVLPSAALDAAARRLEQLLAPPAPSTACSSVALAWAMWAFGRMGYRPPRSLLRRVESTLRRRAAVELYELDPADMARLVWGLAEAAYYSGGLLSDLATVLRSMWQRMPPQSMAMVLRSYATLAFTPHELLDAAAEHVALNLPQYSTQAVAVMAWSFAKLGVHPNRGLPGGGPSTPDGTPLMAAVADFALQHLGEQQLQQAVGREEQQGSGSHWQQQAGCQVQVQEPFTLQGLSMLLWAFAVLRQHPGDELLEAAAARFTTTLQHWAAGDAAAAAGPAGSEAERTAQEQQEPLTLQTVATAAWAFSKLQHPDEAFFVAVADALPALAAQPAEQQGAAAEPAAAAKGRVADRAAGRSSRRLRDEPHGVSSLAFAAAKLRVAAAPRIVHTLLPSVARNMDAFPPGDVCQLLWAMAHVQLPSPPPLALLEAAAARLGDSTASCDPSLLCMAAHALATLGYRAEDALLDACVSQVAAAGPGAVPVSWLAKLLWACAHVGHVPDAEHLEALCDDLYFRLSHARGNRTLLNVPDLVLMVWALAVLEQYECRLYRHATFRAKRLPDGVPSQPHLRRLLREATTLHSAEHRLDPVLADAASAILPVWMSADAQQHQHQHQQGAGGEPGEPVLQLPSPAAVPEPGSEAGAEGSDELAPSKRDVRLAAEAAASALQRAGVPARLMQLSFGDYIVVFERRRGGTGSMRRQGEGSQAAVVPAPVHSGRASVNAPHRLAGSALVACRILAARGVTAVPHTGSEVELLAACAKLRQ